MKLRKQALPLAASIVTVLIIGCITGCRFKRNNVEQFTVIKGMAGIPRFNLQYTYGEFNDVDLYVKTPDGSVVCYSNATAQKGAMDIDCFCGDCLSGANENIYWDAGTAPRGTYQVWASYFDPCLGTTGTANYIIRIMKEQVVLHRYEGVVSTGNRKSPVYTFVY